MPSRRDEILAFYDRLAETPGWDFCDVTRRFVRQLFQDRELAGSHFFTSHEAFCISRFPTYDERNGEPLLSVTASAPDRLHFDFRVELRPEDGVYRSITQSVNCPEDRGLAEFDRLYEKFLAAHP